MLFKNRHSTTTIPISIPSSHEVNTLEPVSFLVCNHFVAKIPKNQRTNRYRNTVTKECRVTATRLMLVRFVLVVTPYKNSFTSRLPRVSSSCRLISKVTNHKPTVPARMVSFGTLCTVVYRTKDFLPRVSYFFHVVVNDSITVAKHVYKKKKVIINVLFVY